MNSLRGSTVWFLCCVTLAAGLMIAAGGIVHAQSTESFTLDGTITDSDGVPAAGLSVEASGFPVKTVTDGNGYYSLPFFSLSRGKISVNDTIIITVKDRDEIVSVKNYVVTAADIAAVPQGATVPIQLSKLQTEVSTTALPADGSSIAIINVLIQVDGENVVGDTLDHHRRPRHRRRRDRQRRRHLYRNVYRAGTRTRRRLDGYHYDYVDEHGRNHHHRRNPHPRAHAG